MFKVLFFLAFLISPGSSTTIQADDHTICTCPNVINLQKTGQTSTSIAYAWQNGYSGAQFKVWYTRQEDSYTSSYFYTYSTSYNFSGLSAGHYTFYFQALCGAESSGYVGVEDVVAN